MCSLLEYHIMWGRLILIAIERGLLEQAKKSILGILKGLLMLIKVLKNSLRI